ncbi:ABC transporter ATP-binding protein [Aeromicrobium sp. YIM 150415]|uniref:ABC transporter ATP-binding protein n=1 Tax=Aeromicrobium sp. YIM 150415 TaxID=2803912 RepID=UPI001964CB35|nr:ABC transporter ATP-binding protein [Aeromicrobium sp. YIM 150415]MBM9465545.1 ABC transporter ATP-binding protein [Aeromicrobium sp. YIM 150415]
MTTVPVLNVQGLEVFFGHGEERVQALHDVSFTIERGEIVGLVGESGSGKTVTSLALMGLIDPRSSRIEGQAELDGTRLWDDANRRRPQAEVPMAMVFQEPMTALDPVFSVGYQLIETLRLRQGLSKARARAAALELLDAVGISDPRARLRAYPHELSGGMRQRVMIAIALACAPQLLIADEPTTAVDVTIQAQLLELIKGIAADRGMSVLFVTHDLGVVAETCDRMITMYAGRIVERGPVGEVLAAPAHPYTSGLLAALPSPQHRDRRLATIPGRVPPPGERITGCVFAPRCQHRADICAEPVELGPFSAAREVRCVRAHEIHTTGADT